MDLADFSRQVKAILKKVERADIERMYHAGYDVETAVRIIKSIKEDNGTR